jgi:hypothetical protein
LPAFLEILPAKLRLFAASMVGRQSKLTPEIAEAFFNRYRESGQPRWPMARTASTNWNSPHVAANLTAADEPEPRRLKAVRTVTSGKSPTRKRSGEKQFVKMWNR